MPNLPPVTSVRDFAPAEPSQWTDLLRDIVASGASLGFLAPLDRALAERYWASVFLDVGARTRVLLAMHEGERLVATVQLALRWQPNAAHRAEVQKLMVHPTARRRGYAGHLLGSVEQHARALRRTLLVLDTQRHDPAERVYRAAGYAYVGSIDDFATDPDGVLRANAIYCKRLEETVPA